MGKRFETRLEGFKKKARQLSTLCDVEICLVVSGSGSQTLTAVWPDGDQTWKAEKIAQRYLNLPPKQPSPQVPPSGVERRRGEYDDHQELHDRLGGFSAEGLRNLARVLEGKLEEAKRKMKAGRRLPRGGPPGRDPARKRAKVGESGRQITLATPGAVVSSCNGAMINGRVLDDQKEEGRLPESSPARERVEEGNLGLATACDSGTNDMVSCSIPAMESCNTNLANLAPWCWPDNSSFIEMLTCDDNSLEIGALWQD